jgi:hypothetical protein
LRWRAPRTGDRPAVAAAVAVAAMGAWSVEGVVSVLRQAASTEDCIIRAVRLGGDTDTCAAIAAGIFAATTGDETISWRDRFRCWPIPHCCNWPRGWLGGAKRPCSRADAKCDIWGWNLAADSGYGRAIPPLGG